MPDGNVREAWSAGPTGESAFVVLDISSTVPQGPARTDFDGDNELERISSPQTHTLTFQTYGKNAYAFAEFARAALQGESARSMFRALKSALMATGQTTDLSGLAGSEEERARFDFTLSFTEILQTELYQIRLADIYVHYEHGTEYVRVLPPEPHIEPTT